MSVDGNSGHIVTPLIDEKVTSEVNNKNIVTADLISNPESLESISPSVSTKRHSSFLFTIVGLVLPALALMPLLILEAREIWGQPTFRFYPAAWFVGFLFFCAKCRFELANRSRGILATFVIVSGIALGIWGMYLVSPSRAQLAFVVVTLGWALGAFGTTHWGRILTIWGLFAITVPLPFALSARFLQWLQLAAGSASSYFLEAVKVPNVYELGLIRIDGMQLNVVNLLTDAGSYAALIAFAIAWTRYRERSFLNTLCVVIASLIWSFFSLFLRLLTYAFLYQAFDVDCTLGAYATIVGVTTFVLSCVFVIVTDQTLSEFFAPISSREGLNDVMQFYQSVVVWPASESLKKDDHPISSFRSAWILVGANTLSLILGACCFWVFFYQPRGNAQRTSISQEIASGFPGKDALPEMIGNIKQVGFANQSQEQMDRYSNVWQFDGGEAQFVVYLDFPFASTASIAQTYNQAGWEIDGKEALQVTTPVPCMVEQIEMRNRFGIRSYSWNAFFNEKGEPMTEEVSPEIEGRKTIFTLLRDDGKQVATKRYFLVRLFFETGREISDAEAEQYRSFFLNLFSRIRQQSLPALQRLQQ